jgi:hypothetical protein
MPTPHTDQELVKVAQSDAANRSTTAGKGRIVHAGARLSNNDASSGEQADLLRYSELLWSVDFVTVTLGSSSNQRRDSKIRQTPRVPRSKLLREMQTRRLPARPSPGMNRS